MIIQDLLTVPGRGTIILVSVHDPDLTGVTSGTRLQQGALTWEVIGREDLGGSRPVGDQVGLLLGDSPSPTRGEITVLP